MMLEFCILLVAVITCSAHDNEAQVAEARGKEKYALLTNLAILLATKVGLFKICVGIALVIGSIKLLVIMAWTLAIIKYIPNNFHSHDQKTLYLDHNPYDHGHGHYGIDDGHGKFVHFFYVVVTKLFILKIIYGALLYALVLKGWHLVSWFIHYLKEKKHHHEYVDYDHEPYHTHHHYGHDHDHNGYGHNHYDHDHDHYGHDHDHYGHDHDHYANHDNHPVSYESDSYGPYPYEKHGYDGFKKAYDADGSFSVQS